MWWSQVGTSIAMLLCFFTSATVARQTKKVNCSIADIVFIMDESSSIWPTPFEQQKQFIKDVIDMFNVGVNETRVGLVRFSTRARVGFNLKNYHDKKNLGRAIDDIQQAGGNTNTGEALRIARDYSFATRQGGRPDNPTIPQIAVVITDGNSQESDKTAKQAKLTHEAGITVFAIGVGNEISHQELKNIASSHEYIFAVQNYDALDTIKNKLGTKACEIEVAKPSVPPENILEGCKEKQMDIALVLDKSSSVDEADFLQMKTLLQGVLYSLDVSDDFSRVAFVSYAASSEVHIPLAASNDRTSVYDSINTIQQAPGDGNLAGAFKTLRSVFNPKYGARTKVAKVVLVVTNTANAKPDIDIAEAKILQQEYGVEIFAVGVDKADKDALKAITGDNHVLMASGYDQLTTAAIRNDISENICPVRPPPQDFACGEKKGADIAFALDTQNAGQSGLSSMHSFIRTVTSKFEIGPQKIQVAFSPNQCQQSEGFDFNTYSAKPQVLEALQHKTKSQTLDVLNKLGSETFTSEKGARSSDSTATKRFAVLFVDGTPGSLEDAKTAAAKAKNDQNIEIFVIGIGPKVKAQDLAQIASGPSHLLLVDSYEKLEGDEQLAGSLSDAICKSLQ